MFLSLDNRRIFYDLLGNPTPGKTVCLTHSLSADSGMWAEQVPPLLAAGYQVLRIDMRGHGASEPVDGDYTMDELADDVAAVLSRLPIGKVNFVGLSIGGMLGQSLALRHPGLLRSACFCDTLPAAIPAAEPVWLERIRIVREAQSLAPVAEGTMERWFTPELKKKRPDRWREIHQSILATDFRGFLGCAAALRSFDFTDRLPGMHIPALVICGANDSGTPPAENQRLAKLIPGAKYIEIDGAQHLPNVQRPEEFNRALIGWLDTVLAE